MSSRYTTDGGIEGVCTYCGQIADSVDHVVPKHLLERAGELELDLSKIMRMRSWQVPACRECNSMLGGKLFATLRERRESAHKSIRRKYASYLRVPSWSEEELSEMGPRASDEIRAALVVRDWIRGRLAWNGATVVDIGAVYGLAQAMIRRAK